MIDVQILEKNVHIYSYHHMIHCKCLKIWSQTNNLLLSAACKVGISAQHLHYITI